MTTDEAGAPPERQRGINRVVIGCWDLDAAVAFYSKLLGAEFIAAHGEEAASFGVRVAFSWDAGIELVAPLPDRESALRTTLEERGEGLVGVVFAVADADASRAAAAELGMETYYSLDYDQATIDTKLQGRYSVYKQHFITPIPPLNGTVLLGEFMPASRAT